MVSATTGRRIPCCWEDCERLGDTRWQVIAREPERNLIYLFCGERHKAFYVHSHRDLRNLPSGSKGGGPVQGAALCPKVG